MPSTTLRCRKGFTASSHLRYFLMVLQVGVSTGTCKTQYMSSEAEFFSVRRMTTCTYKGILLDVEGPAQTCSLQLVDGFCVFFFFVGPVTWGCSVLCELSGWVFIHTSGFNPCWVLPNCKTWSTSPIAAWSPEDRAMYWVRLNFNLALVSCICWLLVFRWLSTIMPSITFLFFSIKHSHVRLLFSCEERYKVIIMWSLN